MSARQGEHSTHPRGRPPEEIKRPKHVAIAGGMVSCRHRNCHYTTGPYLTRTEAVLVAIEHHTTTHRRTHAQ